MAGEPGSKSCILQMVKSSAAMAVQIEHLTKSFGEYLAEERVAHQKIDEAIDKLRGKFDNFFYILLVFLMSVIGFLFIKIMGW